MKSSRIIHVTSAKFVLVISKMESLRDLCVIYKIDDFSMKTQISRGRDAGIREVLSRIKKLKFEKAVILFQNKAMMVYAKGNNQKFKSVTTNCTLITAPLFRQIKTAVSFFN